MGMRRLCGIRAARTAAAIVVSALCALAGRPAAAVSAEPATVTGVTTRMEGRELQVVIRASAPVHYEVQPVRRAWIVVDILNARLGFRAGTVHPAEGVIQQIRAGQFTPDVVRVVVECVAPVRFRVAAAHEESAVIVAIPDGAGRPAAVPAGQRSGATTIVPGRSIGAVRLGMTLPDVVAALGRATNTAERPGVGVDYTWYAASAESGLGVRATGAGIVRRIWVLEDPAYRTREGLHTGSTEADVQAVFGAPSWTVAVASQEKSITLMYEGLGAWFGVRPSAVNGDRNTVFRIDVIEPSSSGTPRSGP
jgi:AMIN domain-containing protein